MEPMINIKVTKEVNKKRKEEKEKEAHIKFSKVKPLKSNHVFTNLNPITVGGTVEYIESLSISKGADSPWA